MNQAQKINRILDKIDNEVFIENALSTGILSYSGKRINVLDHTSKDHCKCRDCFFDYNETKEQCPTKFVYLCEMYNKTFREHIE